MNKELNVKIGPNGLMAALVEAIIELGVETAQTNENKAITKDASDHAPFGQLKLSVKQTPDGVAVKAIVGGVPGKSETVIQTTGHIDRFVASIVDMLEAAGSATSSEVLTEVREVILQAWRVWFGENVILQGVTLGEVERLGFNKRADWDAQVILNKADANDEIAHRSPKSYHELAMLDCDPEPFSYKGKDVLANYLNIGDAIQALEDGYHVACEHWSKEVYLFMATPEAGSGFDDFIAMHTSQGDNTPWSPAQKSLVDRTWCILA